MRVTRRALFPRLLYSSLAPTKRFVRLNRAFSVTEASNGKEQQESGVRTSDSPTENFSEQSDPFASKGSQKDQKREILENALKHVGETGWHEDAFRRAAYDLQLSPAVVGMFPRGSGELVTYFMTDCNEKTLAKLREMPLEDMRPTAILRRGLQIRFEMQIPYISNWSEAISIGASPQNVPYVMESIAKFVDELWTLAADTSNPDSVHWYVKRGAVGLIYSATELFMLTDKSPEYKDTWRFIEDRLQEAQTLSTFTAETQKFVESTVGVAFNSVFNQALQGFRKV